KFEIGECPRTRHLGNQFRGVRFVRLKKERLNRYLLEEFRMGVNDLESARIQQERHDIKFIYGTVVFAIVHERFERPDFLPPWNGHIRNLSSINCIKRVEYFRTAQGL